MFPKGGEHIRVFAEFRREIIEFFSLGIFAFFTTVYLTRDFF